MKATALSLSCALACASQPLADDRALGAILGSFVADAASMPLHWIYDTKKVAKLVGDGKPEFFHTPSCPFYKYALGEDTPYGQQSRVYLAAMSQNSSTRHLAHFTSMHSEKTRLTANNLVF